MRISIQELLIVLVIVIIIFGPSQFPKLAKMFKKSTDSVKKELEKTDDDTKKEDVTPDKNKDDEA